MIGHEDLNYLRKAFSDLLNYDADDVTSPIDPLTYRNPEGDTCLHIAAQRGDIRAVRILLEAGCDINAIGDMGNTPLHYAASALATEVIQLLMEHHAATGIRNEFGRVPLERFAKT